MKQIALLIGPFLSQLEMWARVNSSFICLKVDYRDSAECVATSYIADVTLNRTLRTISNVL